jgi:hypothetical protein
MTTFLPSRSLIGAVQGDDDRGQTLARGDLAPQREGIGAHALLLGYALERELYRTGGGVIETDDLESEHTLGPLRLDVLPCLGRVPDMVFEAPAARIREGEHDVKGLEGSREDLHVLVVDDPPADGDRERAPRAARRLPVAVLVAGLADLERPFQLDGRVEIEDAVAPLRAGDTEILGQVDLPARPRGEDVHVLLDADQLVETVVADPLLAQRVHRPLGPRLGLRLGECRQEQKCERDRNRRSQTRKRLLQP